MTNSNLGANVGVVTSISDAKLSGDNQNRYSVVVQNNQTSQIDPIFINGVSSANGASSGNPGLTFESAQPATGKDQFMPTFIFYNVFGVAKKIALL